MRRHGARLLKADKLAVLGELERQEEVDLAVKVRPSPFSLSFGRNGCFHTFISRLKFEPLSELERVQS